MRKRARWLSAVAILCVGCPGSTARKLDAAPQTTASEFGEIADSIYDGGLKGTWQESGTAARELATGASARVRFGIANEWVLTRPGLGTQYGGILFRVKEPTGEGEFLEVRLGSNEKHAFPAVKLKPDHRTEVGDGWTQVLVPISELDPDGTAFDRIIFRPFRPFGNEWVLFDHIGLAKGSGVPTTTTAAQPKTGPALSTANARPAHARVACDGKLTQISPYIYGIAHGDEGWDKLSATVRRWGGNESTRYNWELNVASHGHDWFYENHPNEAYVSFLADNASHQTPAALTIPMIGWVAKDGTSYSFPVSLFGPQQQSDPYRPDVGNGVSQAGVNISPAPQTHSSVEAPPEWMKRWVSTIRANDAKTGKRSIYEYILDNEPMIWNTNHRDVHPEPVGYDELLDRTIRYGTAIREADPDALIGGPAEWGWSNYFYSAKDLAGSGLHTDRLAHGNVPLEEWYLRKLSEHERKTGTRLLDVFDLHYYPQADNVYGRGTGGSDRATQLLRLRSTRSLWDPSYVDESWIKDTIRLIPRMKEWIDKNYPGRGISIGEWNFGGEKEITGALATAETLGRFAQFGVMSAYYWTAPAQGTNSSFAFVAYRNFDGHGGHFLDWYVPSTPTDGASFFASRDADATHMVIVAINLTPDSALAANLDVSSCGTVVSQSAYVYSRSTTGLTASGPAEPGAATAVDRVLPPWSITVFDLHLRPAR